MRYRAKKRAPGTRPRGPAKPAAGAMVVGVTWYKREDYDVLKRLYKDGDSIHDTFDEWQKEAERVVEELKDKGLVFEKVYLTPDNFPAWCAAKGMDMDANARSQFASESVMERRPSKDD